MMSIDAPIRSASSAIEPTVLIRTFESPSSNPLVKFIFLFLNNYIFEEASFASKLTSCEVRMTYLCPIETSGRLKVGPHQRHVGRLT